MQLCAFQIILEDYPAALGPNYETEAVCLECLSRVDGSYLCSKCNLPLCGEQCTNGPMHLPECQASRKNTFQASFPNRLYFRFSAS